ncbi:bile salt sulfotransferase 2 [Phodopus roborovskii]|uniref:Sulfotransferase n=1 Tax=Phodopus roborovskii TaxID=109678 RepID=A0AAV0A8D2_PHORO|nr:bile salt sulfotransferase 2 [Phodopus roborovskii]CAH7397440.1 Sult2a1 [Phodopus roborovskii]
MSGYIWFEGIPFPTVHIQKEILEEIRHKFVIRDKDTIIVAYPKSGTNWMIETVCLIQTKGNPEWVQSIPSWDRSFWVETVSGYQKLINKEGPHLISSHLPFHLFPKSFFSSKAKMIYIMRNPRDVLVSGYFFWRAAKFVKNPESLTTYFDWFLKGNVPYGSWFEHIRGWLSMRESENVLLLSYEDMKKETRRMVEKICDFLGKKLEPDELDMVLKYSSFQAMKENKMSNFRLMPKESVTHDFVLMRKGVTGDWKNHFTVAQAEAFDKVFQEKMAGFPPELFPWQ